MAPFSRLCLSVWRCKHLLLQSRLLSLRVVEDWDRKGVAEQWDKLYDDTFFQDPPGFPEIVDEQDIINTLALSRDWEARLKRSLTGKRRVVDSAC